MTTIGLARGDASRQIVGAAKGIVEASIVSLELNALT